MNGNYYFRGDKDDYPDLVERDDFRFSCKWVEEENYAYIDYVDDGENRFLLSWVAYPEGEAFDMNVLPSNLNFSLAPPYSRIPQWLCGKISPIRSGKGLSRTRLFPGKSSSLG